MHAIALFIARLKSWQAFILLVLPILAVPLVLTPPEWSASGDIVNPDQKARFLGAGMTLTGVMMIVSLAWFWSIGWVANRAAPPALRSSIGLLGVGAVYAGAFGLLMRYFIPLSSTTGAALPIPEPLFAALFMAAVGSLFLVMGLAAKKLVVAERQSAANLDLGTFVSLWFSPLGVWSVQPRVNKLAALLAAPSRGGTDSKHEA